MEAITGFDQVLRPKFSKVGMIKELWGTECIVVKEDEPQKDRSGEIIAIPVADFIELFQEPIVARQTSANQLIAYIETQKAKLLGWEPIIDSWRKALDC